MVKELEDAPRDEVAVVLDANATAVTGESFDVQVRAAGSILQAYARRGRRSVLVVNAERPQSHQLHSGPADTRQALELLAAAEPTGRAPAHALLGDEASAAARALEIVVVTSRIDRPLVDRLIQRALSRRKASLVYVDAPTFAGAAPTHDPALLRLAGAGVAVAVVRSGDSLAVVLGGEEAKEAVGG